MFSYVLDCNRSVWVSTPDGRIPLSGVFGIDAYGIISVDTQEGCVYYYPEGWVHPSYYEGEEPIEDPTEVPPPPDYEEPIEVPPPAYEEPTEVFPTDDPLFSSQTEKSEEMVAKLNSLLERNLTNRKAMISSKKGGKNYCLHERRYYPSCFGKFRQILEGKKVIIISSEDAETLCLMFPFSNKLETEDHEEGLGPNEWNGFPGHMGLYMPPREVVLSRLYLLAFTRQNHLDKVILKLESLGTEAKEIALHWMEVVLHSWRRQEEWGDATELMNDEVAIREGTHSFVEGLTPEIREGLIHPTDKGNKEEARTMALSWEKAWSEAKANKAQKARAQKARKARELPDVSDTRAFPLLGK